MELCWLCGEHHEKKDHYDCPNCGRPRNPQHTPIRTECVLSEYPVAIFRARRAAKELGYAIGVHGSQTRDLDLIACPWTEEAVSAEELAEAVREAVKGQFFAFPDNETDKPHGRKCWLISLGYGGAHIDLSVMARQAADESKDS